MASSSEDEVEIHDNTVRDLKRKLHAKYRDVVMDPELNELELENGFLQQLHSLLKELESNREMPMPMLIKLDSDSVEVQSKIREAKLKKRRQKNESRRLAVDFEPAVSINLDSSDEDATDPIAWRMPRRLFPAEHRRPLGLGRLHREKSQHRQHDNRQQVPMQISPEMQFNPNIHAPNYVFPMVFPGQQVFQFPVLQPQQPIFPNGMMQMPMVLQRPSDYQQPQQPIMHVQQPFTSSPPNLNGYGGSISSREPASNRFSTEYNQTTSTSSYSYKTRCNNQKSDSKNSRDARTENRDQDLRDSNKPATYGEHRRQRGETPTSRNSRWDSTKRPSPSTSGQTQNNKQRRIESSNDFNRNSGKSDGRSERISSENTQRNQVVLKINERDPRRNAEKSKKNSESSSKVDEPSANVELRHDPRKAQQESSLNKSTKPDEFKSTVVREKSSKPGPVSSKSIESQSSTSTSSKKSTEENPPSDENDQESTPNNNLQDSRQNSTNSSKFSQPKPQKSSEKPSETHESVQESSKSQNSAQECLKNQKSVQNFSKTSNINRNKNQETSQEPPTNENLQLLQTSVINFPISNLDPIEIPGLTSPHSPPLIPPELIKKEKELDIEPSVTSFALNTDIPIKTEIKEEQGNDSETDSNCDSNASTVDDFDADDNPLDGMEDDLNFLASVQNGAGTSNDVRVMEDLEDAAEEKQELIRCKNLLELIGNQSFVLPASSPVMWKTVITGSDDSPRYENPSSPLENDENWDLPPSGSDNITDTEFSSQKDDDDEEYIIPMIPQQPPPMDDQ